MSPNTPRKTFSLSTVVSRVDALLRPAMSKTFWIKAELSSCKFKGDNFFCDLVESNKEGTVLAQLRCYLWASEMKRIHQSFKSEGIELKLRDGMVVAMLCRLQYHPVYGISLRGLDLDPATVLGELELKKRALLATLTQENLHQLNQQIPCHPLPVKIGLITAEGSAAYYDFTKTLFSSNFGFQVQLASATVQGEHCEQTVLRALGCCAQLDIDIVVICRGGGSKLDLAWLDNEAIARAVAHCQHPVWVGIGHEIDSGVLDVVAAQSFKTPTALAEELVARCEGAQQFTRQAQHNLSAAWSYRLENQLNWLQDVKKGTRQGVRKLLNNARSNLKIHIEALGGRTRSKLATAERAQQSQSLKLQHGLKRSLADRLHQLKQASNAIKHSTEKRSERERQRLDFAKERLSPVRIEGLLSKQFNELQNLSRRLQSGSPEGRLRTERALLKSKRSLLNMADPKQNLKRGYAIVKTKGKSLVSTANLKQGDVVDIALANGQLKSRVESITAR